MTDNELMAQAKKRVDFKIHLFITLVSVVLMWVIYYLTWTGYPWPLWYMALSVFSLFVHWLVVFSGVFSTKKEYDRLRRR